MKTSIKNSPTNLAEYMEREYGITPANIDQKLSELKKKIFEREAKQNERCERIQ